MVTGASDQYRGLVQYNHTTDSLALFTNATTKMTILSGGNVGIGLVAPEAKLHISGRVYQDGLGNSTFFGFGAGKADDLSSRNNSAFGYQAFYTNTTGSSNTGNWL